MNDESIAIGIDLGTTNSCAAYVNPSGNVEIIANSEGFRTIYVNHQHTLLYYYCIHY